MSLVNVSLYIVSIGNQSFLPHETLLLLDITVEKLFRCDFIRIFFIRKCENINYSIT